MPSYGTSVTLTYIAWDTSANVGKTGDVANHTLRWIKDGTASVPTNSASEIDATNAPGAYKLTLTTGEGTCQVGTLVGKSSTANVSIIPISVSFELLPTTYYGTAGGIPILDGNGNILADVKRLNGTSQTARDIGASVLLSSGIGTGQLDFTSGVVKSNMTQISGTSPHDGTASLFLKSLKLYQSDYSQSGRSLEILGANPPGIPFASGHSAIRIQGGNKNDVSGIASGEYVSSIEGIGPATFYGGYNGSGIQANILGDLSGSIGFLASQAKADVNAEVKDVMETDTQSEPTGVPLANSSFKEKIGWIFSRFRNKQTFVKSTGVERVYADDSVTTLGTSTDTDDGSTFTKGKMS